MTEPAPADSVTRLMAKLEASVAAAKAARDRLPSYTCPRCGAVSHNPADVAERYCGACHEWETP